MCKKNCKKRKLLPLIFEVFVSDRLMVINYVNKWNDSVFCYEAHYYLRFVKFIVHMQTRMKIN